MKTIKNGRHRLFEAGRQTAATVSEMLLELEKGGMDAVRNMLAHGIPARVRMDRYKA